MKKNIKLKPKVGRQTKETKVNKNKRKTKERKSQ